MDEKIELEIMNERFGKDSLIALATVYNGMPYVRNVNGYYKDGCFYVITYALSNKMKHINLDNNVAISGEWFSAHGKAIDLGWFKDINNIEIAEKLREVFYEWIDNGHNNFDDQNTHILKIVLADGILFSHGKKYLIDFTTI